GNAGAIEGATIQCDQLVSDQSADGEAALADGLRAAGGVFQINHPSDMHWLSRYGYAVVPDTVEVWNIGPWIYQHPFPASNDNNDGDGVYEPIAGDEASPHAVFRVRIENAAPGSVLRLVTDAGSVDVPLAANSSYPFRLGLGGVPAARIFVRAELLEPDAGNTRETACDPVVGAGTTLCRDDLVMEAL